MKFYTLFVPLLLILACKTGETSIMSKTENPVNAAAGKQLSYLALGDSYTIGESVAQQDNFPYQLVAQLKKKCIGS